MAIKVLVADRERTFAEVLASRLEAESDIEMAGAVQLRMPRPHLTTPVSADVLLLDGDLPGPAANRLYRRLSAAQARTRVLTLSICSEPARIVQALRAGVGAWVRKDASVAQLLDAIRSVSRGETWLPQAETGKVVRLLLQERDQHLESERLLAALTPRERTVLDCFAAGAGHRDVVADQLHLSVNTVRTHMQNLMAKLGVHSTLEAVALTRGCAGWLHPDAG
jgi:DNA-binding NarL/FixJ family response regulator